MHDASAKALIEDHLAYTSKIARTCYEEFQLAPYIAFEDVLAYARQGLTEAAHRYSSSRSAATFTSFSWQRIRGAIIDGIRKMTQSRSAYRSKKDALASEEAGDTAPAQDTPTPALLFRSETPVELVPGDRDASPETACEVRQLRLNVLRAIDKLPELERQVVLLHFYEGDTLTEAGRKLGFHRWRASDLHLSALQTLSRSLSQEGADYLVSRAA